MRLVAKLFVLLFSASRSKAPRRLVPAHGRVRAGAYAAKLIDETQRFDITRNACPGAGACGGMYTANTMASAIEALGMSLPYSSSVPAEDPLKMMECRLAGRQVHLLLLLFLTLLLVLFLLVLGSLMQLLLL